MAASIRQDELRKLVERLEPGGELIRAWDLPGGVSAQVTALELGRADGQVRKVVVRRHGEADLKQNPHVAADEFKLLQCLRAAQLPAPEPYLLDESGELFPAPYIVVEYIEGSTDFAPSGLPDALLQLACGLAAIHNVDISTFDLSCIPDNDKIYGAKIATRPALTDESLQEGRIRDILEAAWPLPRRNKDALLHGDFWPGNVIWNDGRLAGIIDWEDARTGDPLADLGNSRLEVLWAFGVDAMRSFTGHYMSAAAPGLDYTDLPYWDLCAALRPAFKIAEWAGGPVREKRMRERHRLFVRQAVDKLSAPYAGCAPHTV